jgi:large subunit ribosomal protein L18
MSTAKKLKSRERTRLRIRKKLIGHTDRPRLSVFRSSKHTYAQLILDEKNATLVAASTLDDAVIAKVKEFTAEAKDSAASTKSVLAAKAVGAVLAAKAKEQGVEAIVFDRGGYLYHGRVKAVADGAREAGLKF